MNLFSLWDHLVAQKARPNFEKDIWPLTFSDMVSSDMYQGIIHLIICHSHQLLMMAWATNFPPKKYSWSPHHCKWKFLDFSSLAYSWLLLWLWLLHRRHALRFGHSRLITPQHSFTLAQALLSLGIIQRVRFTPSLTTNVKMVHIAHLILGPSAPTALSLFAAYLQVHITTIVRSIPSCKVFLSFKTLIVLVKLRP